MHPKVKKAIEEFGLIKKGDRVVLAVSGGSDSIFMFYQFLEIDFVEKCVAHLNHGLREEANEEEKYVRNLCEKYNIPFFSKKINLKNIIERERGNLEDIARRERYKFLYEVKERWGGNKIAIGHNLDDFVETFFLNLLRGTGLRGLRGILPKRNSIIRPLIFIRKKEIENELVKKGIKYFIDKTNFDTRYKRNWLRHKVLPIIEEREKNFFEKILKTSLIIQKVVNYLDNITKKFEKKSPDGEVILDRYKLLDEDNFLKEWVISKYAKDYKHVEKVLDLLIDGGKYYLPEGWKVEISGGDVRFYKSDFFIEKFEIPLKQRLILLKDLNIKIEILENFEGYNRLNLFEAVLDMNKNCYFVRNRREGDRIYLRGLGWKKIKDFFIDKKIPRWRRDKIPLVVDDKGQIVWVVGFLKIKEDKKGFLVRFSKIDEKKFWIFD